MSRGEGTRASRAENAGQKQDLRDELEVHIHIAAEVPVEKKSARVIGEGPRKQMIEQAQHDAKKHVRHAKDDRQLHLERVGEGQLVVSQRPQLSPLERVIACRGAPNRVDAKVVRARKVAVDVERDQVGAGVGAGRNGVVGGQMPAASTLVTSAIRPMQTRWARV